MASTDLLIIGGGIVGVTVALEARRRDPGRSVLLVDKEESCGTHASSRNSGVLHAGFYYAADSLKARFTVEGNRRLTEYCLDRGLPINQCGKLVVTRSDSELSVLEELAIRAGRNGCDTRLVSRDEARELEPRVKTVERALYSPTTSSVSPRSVMEALVEDARSAGVSIRTGCKYRTRVGDRIRFANGESVVTGHVVNAAGLYADAVAKDFGFAERYVILPFKGVYLTAERGTEPVRVHVYPVPDLTNQFHLGLHFTVTADGVTKIGPTAIPALWREQYARFQNFRFGEVVDVVRRQMTLLRRNDFGFRRLAVDEMRKYSKSHLVRLASTLLTDVDASNFKKWGRPGIRAQLYDTTAEKLELDFVVEGDDRSTHVLNAVSPAFTCCLPFAEHVLDRIERVSNL